MARRGPRAPSSEEVDSEAPIQRIRPDGRVVDGQTVDLAPDRLESLFRGMLRIRVLDARMLNLQRQGRIGFFGQCTGQEAAIVGSAAAARPEDWVLPALREAGVALFRGYPIRTLLAQLAGRASEVSQGRQMPCHHSFRAGNFVSMSSVIGTQLPHAAGIARAAQIRGDDVAVVGYLGDGASSSSDFHSALNFAAVWKAPVLFFCQNNQWAISVPFSKQSATKSVAEKAAAYGMPGIRVDGNDVVAVLEETTRALDSVRSGDGPVLLEALTYRRLGHSSSDDPTRYREDAEVEKWKARDPIERLRLYMRREGLLDQAQEDRVEEEIHQEISAAVESMERDESPSLESLVDDVFVERSVALQEQIRALMAYVATVA